MFGRKKKVVIEKNQNEENKILMNKIYMETVEINKEIKQLDKKLDYLMDTKNKIEWRMVIDQKNMLSNKLKLKEKQINAISRKISNIEASETVKTSKSINVELQTGDNFVDVDEVVDTLDEANSISDEITKNYNTINNKLSGENNDMYDFDRAYENRLIEKNREQEKEETEMLENAEKLKNNQQ